MDPVRSGFAVVFGLIMTYGLYWLLDASMGTEIILYGVNVVVVLAYTIGLFAIVTFAVKYRLYTSYRIWYVVGCGIAIALWIGNWTGGGV